MIYIELVIAAILFIIPSAGKAQNDLNRTIQKDSVYIDSLVVINKKFLKEFDKFYERNKKSIDINSCFVIFIVGYKENDTSVYCVDISLGNDMENNLQHIRENKSGYFKYKNTLVLIPILIDETCLFLRTSKKLFIFNHKESITYCRGFSQTQVGYKIKKINTSKIKIRKIYYIK